MDSRLGTSQRTRQLRLGLDGQYRKGSAHDARRAESSSGLVLEEVENLLNNFAGLNDLKRLFWSMLSYERVNRPVRCPPLASGREQYVEEVLLFARHDEFWVLLVRLACQADRPFLTTLCHQLAAKFPTCALLLEEPGGNWRVVLPDEQTKYYLRWLEVPGHKYQRRHTAQALTAFSAYDEEAEKGKTAFDIFLELDLWFPGPRLPPRTDLPEIEQYLKDAQNYPLLTKHQEWMPANIRNLIVHNLRLVVWLADQFSYPGMTLADLVQAGNLGLMRAAQKFDPSMGNRFSTYAYHWIKQGIRREASNNLNLVYWPNYRAWELHRKNRNGKTHQLTPGERTVRSISAGSGQRLAARVPADGRTAEDKIYSRELIRICVEALGHLAPRKRAILKLRYGIGGYDTYTLEEIGDRFGLTRERIRQIQEDAECQLDTLFRERFPEVAALLETARDMHESDATA